MSHPGTEELSESNGLTLSQDRTDRFDIFGTYTVIILQKYQDTIKILYNGILSWSQNLILAHKEHQKSAKICLKTILETQNIYNSCYSSCLWLNIH